MDLQRPDSYQGGAGPDFNEQVLHKTILVGDSGVGKTSLLVQFDQGKFIPGSFSATVGIGFTRLPVAPWRAFPGWRRSAGVDLAVPRNYSPAYLLPGDMTCTPGEATAWDGEAPRTCPPCVQNYDLTGKVMLLGDSGVGKTCFLIQFKDGAFLSGTFLATVGIDFRNKVVSVDGATVKLQIWDTAGQERFRSVTHAYYRDAQALLLLYDITNRASFDNIRAWLTEIHEYAQRDVVIMLLGNKADVSSERVIRSEDGETLAREYGVPFMETSAKTGMNVELAFLAIAKELIHRAGHQTHEPSFQIRDYVRSQKQHSSCCTLA